MYESLNWLAPTARKKFHWLLCMFKCIHFNFLPHFKQYLIPFSSHYSLRNTDQFLLGFFFTPSFNKKIGLHAFQFKADIEIIDLPQLAVSPLSVC